MTAAASTRKSIESRLKTWFTQRGNMRVPNETRKAANRVKPGARKKTASTAKKGYKKGYEVRISATGDDEVEELLGLLRAASFTPGAPYSKHGNTIVPVYGREEVARFARIMSIDLSRPDGHRKR